MLNYAEFDRNELGRSFAKLCKLNVILQNFAILTLRKDDSQIFTKQPEVYFKVQWFADVTITKKF